MKKLLFFTVAALVGCGNINFKVVRPSENIVSRSIATPAPFTNVTLSGVADIEYTQSTDGTTSVEIFAPDNVIDLLEVSSAGGTLRVGMKPHITIMGDTDITVRASSPGLNGVTVSGAGDFETKGVTTQGDMTIVVSGAGDVEFDNLACRQLSVKVSGAGDVNLERGAAASAICEVSGAGEIDADGLSAQSVVAKVSGAGDVSCRAVRSVDAAVSGVGSIEVHGRPAQVKQKSSGVGSIYIR